MSSAEVSIIIPTYDNQDTISICLESIEQQTYDNLETIVVDGGSSDLTKDLCRRYGVTLLETELGRSAARVEGARRASGEFLFHVDSDMELPPSAVEECVQQTKTVDASVIPETNVGDSYWARCTDIGKTISRKLETGNLRFLPRELYFGVGGHNPELVGKEDEELHNLVLSTGASIDCTEQPIRHHIGDVGFLEILSQRLAYIRSLSAYEEHARIDAPLAEPESPKSIARVLLEEAKERPQMMVGYLILQASTALLARTNRDL